MHRERTGCGLGRNTTRAGAFGGACKRICKLRDERPCRPRDCDDYAVCTKARSLLQRNSPNRLQRHWPKQAGFQRLIGRSPVMPGREGKSTGRRRLVVENPLRPFRQSKSVPFPVRRQLFVADQAIGPIVRDANLQIVRAGLARPVISTRNGGFHRMPRSSPLSFTCARFFTRPRFR